MYSMLLALSLTSGPATPEAGTGCTGAHAVRLVPARVMVPVQSAGCSGMSRAPLFGRRVMVVSTAAKPVEAPKVVLPPPPTLPVPMAKPPGGANVYVVPKAVAPNFITRFRLFGGLSACPSCR